mmetsp:Transcript_57745/g.148543  ORF Transcript_57745/g.148543 Transcript_57745/m.148543 type:complete len:486 (+) Transcript_57745:115-1572(+)
MLKELIPPCSRARRRSKDPPLRGLGLGALPPAGAVVGERDVVVLDCPRTAGLVLHDEGSGHGDAHLLRGAAVAVPVSVVAVHEREVSPGHGVRVRILLALLPGATQEEGVGIWEDRGIGQRAIQADHVLLPGGTVAAALDPHWKRRHRRVHAHGLHHELADVVLLGKVHADDARRLVARQDVAHHKVDRQGYGSAAGEHDHVHVRRGHQVELAVGPVLAAPLLLDGHLVLLCPQCPGLQRPLCEQVPVQEPARHGSGHEGHHKVIGLQRRELLRLDGCDVHVQGDLVQDRDDPLCHDGLALGGVDDVAGEAGDLSVVRVEDGGRGEALPELAPQKVHGPSTGPALSVVAQLREEGPHEGVIVVLVAEAHPAGLRPEYVVEGGTQGQAALALQRAGSNLGPDLQQLLLARFEVVVHLRVATGAISDIGVALCPVLEPLLRGHAPILRVARKRGEQLVGVAERVFGAIHGEPDPKEAVRIRIRIVHR